MITLKAHELGWVKGPADDPADQCAHGSVELTVNGTAFIRPRDGEWTVSAAALFLLRTLSFDHSQEVPISEANFLFPCCGHTVFPFKGKFDVIVQGCCNGIDINVRHKDGKVTLAGSYRNEKVTESEWKEAVLGFATQIRDFYKSCSPKNRIKNDEERKGWELFWQEWEKRVADAQ